MHDIESSLTLDVVERPQVRDDFDRAMELDVDLCPLFDKLYEHVGCVLDATVFFVALENHRRGMVELAYVRTEGRLDARREMPFGTSLAGQIIRSGHALLLQSDREYHVYVGAHGVVSDVLNDRSPVSESYLCVPLQSAGRVIGALGVQSRQPNAYTVDHIQILEAIAAPTAIAIENALRFAERTHSMEERARSETAQTDAAEKASRLKSEFLAAMSHELRTPLNAIIGFSEILYDGRVGYVPPFQKELVGDIHSNAMHLLHLIGDVSDLARVEAGEVEIHPEPVDLALIVSEVLESLRARAAEKRLQVASEVDAALERIVVDAVRLKQVLYNYVSNAIQFTEPRGHVTVRMLPQGPDRFRVEVQDTGTGIPADALALLFTEFQQLNPGSGKWHRGTGLGLALTRRVVEAQGGIVGVRSVSGHGSTFHAVLPRVVNA